MQSACDRRFFALDKSFTDYGGTAWRGKLAADRIDIDKLDPWRRHKIRHGSSGGGADHEIGPDWQRSLRTGETEFALVIEPHPNHS